MTTTSNKHQQSKLVSTQCQDNGFPTITTLKRTSQISPTTLIFQKKPKIMTAFYQNGHFTQPIKDHSKTRIFLLQANLKQITQILINK